MIYIKDRVHPLMLHESLLLLTNEEASQTTTEEGLEEAVTPEYHHPGFWFGDAEHHIRLWSTPNDHRD